MEKTKKPFLIAFAGIVVLSMLAVMPAPGSADTFNVPEDYPTIQVGIDAASDGHMVLVADGTYVGEGNRNLDFEGKAITVRSENGPKRCIIDCEGQDRGFWFHSGEDSSSVVDGFTIMNGWAPTGGGMYNYASSPTVTNCIFTGNSAGYYGGGMGNSLSSPTVTNCIFTGNSAGDYGGGMYNFVSSPTVTNCTFTGNSAGTDGGGMCNDGMFNSLSSPTVTNCILWGDEPSESEVYNRYGTSEFITYCYMGEDPVFVSPGYWDGSNWVEGDYHLQEGSPCIDSGDNDALGLPETDADGNTRIVDGDGDGIETVDMGAFEYQVATNTPMECFKVNYMKVIDRTKHGAKRDKIKIAGSFKVAEDAFDSGDDVVTVAINDKVITIEESFKEKHFLWLHYYCFRGDIDDVSVHMHLNFDRCRWWVKIDGMEASEAVQSKTATVKLTIGMNAGEDSFGWTKEWEGHKIGFAEFIEWSSIHCCGW